LPGDTAQEEQRRLQNRCEVQRELLAAIINKTMFSMLVEQQQMLADMRFPGFSISFADSLKAVPRQNMLASSSTTSFFEENITKEIQKQQTLVCALLSVRLLNVSQRGIPRLNRSLSTDSEGLSEDAEGKRMRKRRRSVQPSYGQIGGDAFVPIFGQK
jgi:hypothetical protein